MKFKPESVTWKVDREYSRWFSIKTHGENGCRKHKVLITSWKHRHRNALGEDMRWQATIISPHNVPLTSFVFGGTTRSKAVRKALDEFESHLKRNGEWT